jgi:hypothetical protein
MMSPFLVLKIKRTGFSYYLADPLESVLNKRLSGVFCDFYTSWPRDWLLRHNSIHRTCGFRVTPDSGHCRFYKKYGGALPQVVDTTTPSGKVCTCLKLPSDWGRCWRQAGKSN